MSQGLLDFGADFQADLERAAEWVARSIRAIDETIRVLKDGLKQSGKKKDVAQRIGVNTEVDVDAEETLKDLQVLRKQYEMIGNYPELVQKAEYWDGESEVDPVGDYLDKARRERLEAEAEGEMSADEYLEAREKAEAEKLVPGLFGDGMSMEMRDVQSPEKLGEAQSYKARTGGEKFAPDANRKEPMLPVNVHALLEDGTKAKKNDLIADETGSVFWGRLPELEALKDKGYDSLDIIMRLGAGPDGFVHIVRKHGQWIMDATGIDDPVRACKTFVSDVLGEVRKIQYQKNKGKDALLLKQGEEQRYFIVVVGKDRVEPKFAAIRTAFVASEPGRFDSEVTLYEGEEALELRIPMSSFGENQRFRVTSERQDRSPDYPDAAASSPSKDIMPEVGSVVKHEELISYKNAKGVLRSDADVAENNEPGESPVTFSMRTKAEPKVKGIGYKVFYRGKDGKLYPPMVANPGGADTPVGVWLDADEGVRAGVSKTGRQQVKAGGKGTQGGSGTLAYRPGWHLGKIPYALQFNRKNPVTGERDLFPADFVWAEVEYAADVDYQEEAMSYGVNKNGKFQHSLAGLPRIPEDGYYEYRTNPNPKTDPWIITGAMKVVRVLTREQVDELVRAAGREPQMVEGDEPGAPVTFSMETVREMAEIKAEAEKSGTFMKAPNGKRSLLTEMQWLQVRTGAFKRWFGDWENDPANASKVVDENGEPLVVYHGSPHYGFTVFDKSRRGERDKGDFGRGFYFTPNRGYAATYGKEGYWNTEGDDSKVYACFLNIREPMQVQARQAENMERWRFEDEEGVMVYTDKFYDLAWNDVTNLSEIVVHDSTQIKSATDNRGTFDGENADITYSIIGPKAQTWDEYADRAFVGRDDGMMRAEIDASGAVLKARMKPESVYKHEVHKARRMLEDGAYYSAEYDRMNSARRLANVVDSDIMTGGKLRDSDLWKNLQSFICSGKEPLKFLEEFGLSEESQWNDILRAQEQTAEEFREAQWQLAEIAGVGRESFDIAYENMFGERHDSELHVRTPNDWEGLGDTLGDILDYPELYAAYPELRNVRMRYKPGYASYGRMPRGKGIEAVEIILGTDKTEEQMRGTLMHEVQHIIQMHEDFAFGGTSSNVRAIFSVLGRLNELGELEDAGTDYKRLSGEIEARGVAKRQFMSLDERLARPFNESMEYPGEALTYRPSEYYEAVAKGGATFSIIGPSALTWDRYADQAFKGRDDGKLRAELDASRARVKDGVFGFDKVKVYRQLIADWGQLPEDERFAVLNYVDLHDEYRSARIAWRDSVGAEAAEAVMRVKHDAAEAAKPAAVAAMESWFAQRGVRLGEEITDNDTMVKLAESFWYGNADSVVELALTSRDNTARLGDVLDYAELYEAYPWLAEMEVVVRDLGGSYLGQVREYRRPDEHIVIDMRLLGDWGRFRSVLLHEVQHVVQGIEGYAKGGNKESVYEHMKDRLEYNDWQMQMLARELRWLSGLDNAKDYLKTARRLLKYPNAWKYNGLRYKHWKATLDGSDVARLMVDDIAGQYEELRQADVVETERRNHVIKEAEYVLPEVDFSDISGIERGLAALAKLKPRRSAFRGEAPKKNKRYVELLRYSQAAKNMLKKYKFEPYELYVRLAGEIEARNVQARMNMTASERVQTPFNKTLEYPGEALVTFSLGRNMADVMAEWENTLDGYLQSPPQPGTPEHTRDLVVCPTPAVMQMVGAKGLDMVVTPGVLDKVMNDKHAVTEDALRQLPAALAEPVCIAVSDTPGCLEVITELKEGEHNVLVAVQLNSHRTNNVLVKVNRIASIYGKERIEKLMNHPMLYWDKVKARPWLASYRLQLPAIIHPRRASGKRIQTPADLVKYKMDRGLSFSLSGPSILDAAPTGRMAGEEKMQRLLNYARKEAARWGRTFSKETPNARAAEAMGTVSSLLSSIHKELPPKYRPKVDSHMRYVEVFARLIESGKIRTYGKLNKEERAAVEAELMDVLREEQQRVEEEYEQAKAEAMQTAALTGEMAALEEAELMDVEDEVQRAAYLERVAKRAEAETRKRLLAEAEAKKKKLDAEVEALKRDFGAEKLAEIAQRMLTDAANSMERYLIDETLDIVPTLLERMAPKKLPNGKFDKGKMSADGYRKLVRYVEMIDSTADEVAERMEALGLQIAAEEAKSDKEKETVDGDKLDALQAELAEWSTYGNLRGKRLDAVRAGVQALVDFAAYEKNAWQGMLQLKRARIKRQALKAAEALGGADEHKVKKVVEQEDRLMHKAGNLLGSFQSLSQMFYGLGGVPELRALADESLDALSAGHVALTMREKRAYEQLAEFMKTELGLDTENKRNDFMAALKKLHDTGIRKAGELVHHKLKLDPKDAAMWVSMTKEERDAKRAEMEAEAEKHGVLVENVPYEEDIPLLETELKRYNEKPEGRKWIHTEREFRREGPAETMKLSKDEALNILLLCEQEDYVDAAAENGYTAEVLDELREFVGEDVLAFGHAMREVLENNGLAEVYEAREGVPFPKVANYWPGNFDQSARANEQANALDPTSGNGTRYGMLITRVKHKLKFNILGASNVFMAALAQQNNYICIGELTAKWRGLLSHSDFAMSLKAHMGDHSFKMLKELINLLDGAGVQESITQQTLSGMLAQFQSAHAMAVLAGAPITLVKQVSAMLNAGAWHGVSMSRVLARIVLKTYFEYAVRYCNPHRFPQTSEERKRL